MNARTPTTPLHGPTLAGSTARFRLWAPDRQRIELVLFERSGAGEAPREVRRLAMGREGDGFHVASVDGLSPGALYMFSPDGEGPFPDPASRYQPFGVHGPSELVDPKAFRWTDRDFRGRPLDELVIYEVHVGTATTEGTFRALIDRLDHVRALGANAIEIMPIADFAGDRNWGYDGVDLFAPARCYGRPEDFAALVDAAHARGLSVILDCVYNHFGPSGNYLRAWSKRYFTDAHKTPWGDAVNYDGEGAAPVRAFVLENVAQWIRDYHVDGLRLDATHAIVDDGPRHLLAEIAERARSEGAGRSIVVIAEDERNEAALIREHGLDAVWADDFHHCVRRLVAGDDEAWFRDFRGDLDELVTILERGWLYEGQTSVVHGGPRGTAATGLPPRAFVHCLQNHDQVGNRATGDRLHHAIDLGRLRAVTTLLLASPYTPLLFMGQEFAASSPFTYFTDHEPELGRLVTEGRRSEFAKFRAFADETRRHEIPDPQDPRSFARSKLDWRETERSPGREILALHQALLALRREDPAMRAKASVARAGDLLLLRRGDLLFVIAPIGGAALEVDAHPLSRGASEIVLDTEDPRFGGARAAAFDRRRLVLAGPGAVVVRTRG
jgi:maltooligosyltrehalose trehalohydrolase